MAKATLTVPEISCEHCEMAITETLTPQAGIMSVKVDIPQQLVHLEFDEVQINLERVEELLEEEGYPVASVR